MGFHFFELPKLPADVSDGDMLLLWLSLFKAETEEELEKIKEMEVPVMSQAINAYYTITASSEFREKERLRAKARHDEAQALHNARKERDIEIARNALKMNMSVDDIMKLTTGRYYIPSGRLIQALDYSHRNPDGTPARTPDSLTNEFKTRAGRSVRDGGGITPDVTVTARPMNRLIYNIIADLWAFDYANRFAAAHPDSVPVGEFEVTDSIFNDFKAFIDPARFKYDRQCESALEYLRTAARDEGYMTDSVAAQFDVLSAMLKHDLDHDLDINRNDIKELLRDEIAARYYDDGARVLITLPGDSVYLRAAELIADPQQYNSILSPR